MFTHNINPILLSIGPLQIRYYALVYIIGFLLGWYVLNKKRQELKLEKKDVENFVFYLILGVVIGSRVLHILLWDPAYYFQNPLKIFAFWEGGMSFHGGLLGVMLAVYYFVKKHKLSFLKLADILTFPALFALALGRIANFINAEIVGTITNVRWCFKFPGYEGCRHPVQLYGAAGRFILLGYLAALNKVKKFKDGFIFWNFVFFMGLGRFFCDFFRQDPRILGLSLGQGLSLVMVAVAGLVLMKYHRKQ
ncbi:prolipoprotein diacylglyceryl transferase [Candidatus Woesearchaeota archaeon]|nr:prolipoprotein diacylglyceryl transferase [Candidatus Woesearchaeota archaeon]